MSAEALKERAALEAVKHVRSGMTLGLGTGSTARYATVAIGELLRRGELGDIRAAVTSVETARLAREGGIPVIDLGPEGVDLAIDGMDEVTDSLDVIKGLGGALLREKIVEARAHIFILIGDVSKRVAYLGEKAPVPTEVLEFGSGAAKKDLEALGCRPVLRERDGQLVRSDNGNLLLDCHFDALFDPQQVAAAMSQLPGVLEHGLFLGMADFAYIADETQVVRLERP